MRVAIIGTTNSASTVGTALARAGHDVVLASRPAGDPSPPPDTAVAPVVDALTGADVVHLALRTPEVRGFLAKHGPQLAGPLVVDATNNGHRAATSAQPVITAALPRVRYARAFNTRGWEAFADPDPDGRRADMFFSTADVADREVTEELIGAVGMRPVYLGAGRHDAVDHALPLWFAFLRERGDRRIAVRVLEA